MRRAAWLLYLLLVVPLATADGDGADLQSASTIAVQGEALKDGKFRLSVEYMPAEAIEHRALLVRAEPSGTLILAHWDTTPSVSMRETALMVTSGPLGQSHPRVTFRWTPVETDDSITVSLLTASGDEFVVAGYRSDEPLTNFHFETLFDERDSSIAGGPWGGYKHCCWCSEESGCGVMCEFCATPYFECNCIGPICSIGCGWG